MTSDAISRILEIQAAELRIDQLRHRINHHPLQADLAAADDALGAHDESAAPTVEARQGLSDRQKTLQREVSTIESKRKDIDGKLYGGEVTASKELLALQDEAASLLARQRGFEDEELELMEAAEVADADLAQLAEARAEIEARRSAVETELDRAVVDLRAEVVAAEAERDTLVPEADPELLSQYRAQRDEYEGTPVAQLVNGACSGCHIHLSAVAIDLMAKLPDDALATCEECGRLLVR